MLSALLLPDQTLALSFFAGAALIGLGVVLALMSDARQPIGARPIEQRAYDEG